MLIGKQTENRLMMDVRELVREVEEIMKSKYGVKFFRLKAVDELRLWRLRIWQQRYRVEVEWMLAVLVKFWQAQQLKKTGREGAVFGTRVAALTGRVSEEILQQAIEREFPDDQQRDLWRGQLQQRQLKQSERTTKIELDWEDPDKALRDYREWARDQRRERTDMQREQQRRRYDGSPWW